MLFDDALYTLGISIAFAIRSVDLALERGNLDLSYSINMPILWIENLDSM